MNSSVILAKIGNDISTVIDLHLNDIETLGIGSEEITELIEHVLTQVFDDLKAFCKGDPASNKSENYVYNSYSSFKAVMYYRIATSIFYYHEVINGWLDYEQEESRDLQQVLQLIARRISEDAKKETTIEIHPAAKIGQRFVIDHGAKTVIGATTEIGDDCYILQGIVLGAKSIANNITGRRHPKLGNKVEIASFAKLLGPIEIGDNVTIGPNCIITENIPANSKVLMFTQCQILKSKAFDSIVVYGVVPYDSSLLIYGTGLKAADPILLIGENEEVTCIDMIMNTRSNTEISITIKGNKDSLCTIPMDKLMLGFKQSGVITHIIIASKGFHDYLYSIFPQERG